MPGKPCFQNMHANRYKSPKPVPHDTLAVLTRRSQSHSYARREPPTSTRCANRRSEDREPRFNWASENGVGNVQRKESVQTTLWLWRGESVSKSSRIGPTTMDSRTARPD